MDPYITLFLPRVKDISIVLSNTCTLMAIIKQSIIYMIYTVAELIYISYQILDC